MAFPTLVRKDRLLPFGVVLLVQSALLSGCVEETHTPLVSPSMDTAQAAFYVARELTDLPPAKIELVGFSSDSESAIRKLLESHQWNYPRETDSDFDERLHPIEGEIRLELEKRKENVFFVFASSYHYYRNTAGYGRSGDLQVSYRDGKWKTISRVLMPFLLLPVDSVAKQMISEQEKTMLLML